MRRRVVVAVAFAIGAAVCAIAAQEPVTPVTLALIADIAVFDRNLIEAGRSRPADLLTARVRYTIVGGRVVFAAN